MLNLYNVKENIATISSPTFTLATCPRMFLELTVENLSRGSHTNEWAEDAGGAAPGGATSKSTPIAGNLSLVVYFEKRVDHLKLKITVGPPETEICRVLSHKDLMPISQHWHYDDPRNRGSRLHSTSTGQIMHRITQKKTGRVDL